jgi:hypothetical protein
LDAIKSALVRIDTQKSNPPLGRIEAYTVNMQKQEGTVDCGLFAIATALELCHHNNPAKIKFRQDKMREHFQKCLEQKKLTQFPRELEDVENVDYNLYKFNRPQLKPF